MAYMNKELKAALVVEVKKVLPKNWKASFSIKNYSTIVMTISKADFDISIFGEEAAKYGYDSFSHRLKNTSDERVNEILAKVYAALNGKNYDKSDVMTDYFETGYYVRINIGTYEKNYEMI